MPGAQAVVINATPTAKKLHLATLIISPFLAFDF
jgi:hypothetical protein